MARTYQELKPEQVDIVFAKTTDRGPYVEDLFFYVKAGEDFFKIPNTEAGPLLQWLGDFPDVDWEHAIEAATCVECRLFILWKNPNARFGANYSKDAKSLLKTRLNALLGSAGLPEADASRIGSSIIEAYEESHREYHGLRHIHHCLWELDRLEDPHLDRSSIELATWYHDLIHDPKRRDNEIRSAERFRKDLDPVLPPEKSKKINEMILMSAHVDVGDTPDRDAKVFLDIDMSVLGLSDIEFLVYENGIRKEFSSVPRLLFYYHRKRFLKGLLKWGIYLTEEFRERYEERARENIRWLLRSWPYKWMPAFR